MLISDPWTEDDVSSPSFSETSEPSTFMPVGASEIEVAWVLREEILEDEESLPDSSDIEDEGRFFVNSSGLDPALEVI